MAGPTTSYGSIDDIILDYEEGDGEGDVQGGDLIFVTGDLAPGIPTGWVLVLDPFDPLNDPPQVIPVEAPTIEAYFDYTVSYAIYPGTPTELTGGGGTIVNDPECGAGPLASGQLAIAGSAADVEYESMDRGAGSGSEGEPFDSADLISTPSIT